MTGNIAKPPHPARIGNVGNVGNVGNLGNLTGNWLSANTQMADCGVSFRTR
jgi:hypothetical protein